MKWPLVYHLLWGYDLNHINSYHRFGDSYYFTFFTFQVLRTVSIFILLVHIFLMFYLDMKESLFLIQDWK